MRGRKPKPPHLKLIAGNPGRRPLATPPQVPATLPQCPRHLHGEARKEWKRLAPQLFAAGLLTELDVAALGALCVARAHWAEANRQLAAEGLTVTSRGGAIKASPWVAIAARAQRDMQLLGAEFGLTPLSRQRIKVELPPSLDPFDDLLSS